MQWRVRRQISGVGSQNQVARDEQLKEDHANVEKEI